MRQCLTTIQHICTAAAVAWTVGCGGDKPPASPSTHADTPVPGKPGRFHRVLEAEALPDIQAPMEVVAEAGSSDGKCVRIPVGAGKPPAAAGRLSIDVGVPVAGPVHLWFRTLWSGSCANSLLVKLPGMPEAIVGEDGTYKHWHWVRGPSAQLPAGANHIIVRQREDDIAIDQILITSDDEYVPMGIEE